VLWRDKAHRERKRLVSERRAREEEQAGWAREREAWRAAREEQESREAALEAELEAERGKVRAAEAEIQRLQEVRRYTHASYVMSTYFFYFIFFFYFRSCGAGRRCRATASCAPA
jgi:hypothetical protein